MTMNINNVESKRVIETTEELEKILSELQDKSNLINFIETVRHIVAKNAFEMFSPENIDHVSHQLGIEGIIYLEKFDDRRHVSVILNLNRDSLNLYDPLTGIKVKRYDEIQFGMYC